MGTYTAASQIKGAIWDLDGTKYHFMPGFYEACDKATVKAAREVWAQHLPHEPIPDDASLQRRATQSYADHKLSYMFLVLEHKIPQDALHHNYHRHAPMHLVGQTPNLRDSFTKVSHLQHIIYTHADARWTEEVLERCNLREFYPDERIVTVERVNFARKNEVRDGFDHCARVLGLPLNQLAMIDDTPECLAIPKELGMQTVLITQGRDMPAYDFVDHRVEDGAAAARLLHRLSL